MRPFTRSSYSLCAWKHAVRCLLLLCALQSLITRCFVLLLFADRIGGGLRKGGYVASSQLILVLVLYCGLCPRAATEIQNIQIADGDVCRNLVIPIYMVFPRLFTVRRSRKDVLVSSSQPGGRVHQITSSRRTSP